MAEDNSQLKFVHPPRRRPMKEHADGFEVDQRQTRPSDGLSILNCDPPQTLSDLIYPDSSDFQKRLAQAAISTQCNSLTLGNPTIVSGTLTPQWVLHKNQTLETLTNNYRDELFRPGIPPSLAHSRFGNEDLQTSHMHMDNRDSPHSSSYEYVLQDQGHPRDSANSILPGDLSLDAFDLEVLELAGKCAATPERVIRTHEFATDPGWHQPAQHPYTSQFHDEHQKSPDRCLVQPPSSIINESIETDRLSLRPSRDHRQEHFNPFRGPQFLL